MRYKKCLKIDFYALGQEHTAFVDPKEKRIEEIHQLVSSIWETAKVIKVEAVQVPVSVYKSNHLFKLEEFLNQCGIYNKD